MRTPYVLEMMRGKKNINRNITRALLKAYSFKKQILCITILISSIVEAIFP